MTQTRAGGAVLSMLLLFLLLVGQLQLPSGLPPRAPQAGLQAAVKIKTQKAADSIEGGIRGIDVSKWQGSINWSKVAKDDVAFAMIRASIGTEKDPLFVTNARAAHENGLKVGAYHYATFTDAKSMRAQAALFLKQLEQVHITYPVVLDVEAHRGLKRSTLTQLCIDFMEILRQKGYTVMLYSYQNFFTKHLDTGKLSEYDLWVANYLEQPKNITHAMWQHTSYGTVKGIGGRVDINIAYSDLSVKKKTPAANPVPVSVSISETLDSRYNTGVVLEEGDLAQLNYAFWKGLQSEINRQWKTSIPVTGDFDDICMNYLQELKFTRKTNGNITYLLQAKLFYLGHYPHEPSSYFDEDTSAAVASYQESQGLAPTGELDLETLYSLLYL